MNEETAQQYDAIIIGVGQAGKPLAKSLSDKGWKIAVIEEAHEGGSCVNFGCTPTKAMIASAEISQLIKNSSDWGISISGTAVDFESVIQRRDNIVSNFRSGIEHMLESSDNINFIRGRALFRNKNLIEVQNVEAGKIQNLISSEKIFINTGSLPVIPEITGLKDIDYFTARTWMSVKKIPQKLAILGGGYIGLEFAQMFHRLGSEVTIFQLTDQILPSEDDDVANEMLEILWDEGITVHLNSEIEQISKNRDGSLEIQFCEGQMRRSLTSSHFLIAAGTKAATANLGLDRAGIITDKEGYIEVNDFLETNVKGVYALGDCKGGPEFTHISYDDFRIINDHLFGEKRRKVSDRQVPYTLFTDPQLGRIGLNEKQCKEKNISYRKALLPAENIARAMETGFTKGMMKVLVGEDDKILGASILLRQGGEISSLIQTAMMGGLRYQVLRDAVLAHPTYAESLNNLFMKL